MTDLVKRLRDVIYSDSIKAKHQLLRLAADRIEELEAQLGITAWETSKESLQVGKPDLPIPKVHVCKYEPCRIFVAGFCDCRFEEEGGDDD
jgi:hypothetical protein